MFCVKFIYISLIFVGACGQKPRQARRGRLGLELGGGRSVGWLCLNRFTLKMELKLDYI